MIVKEELWKKVALPAMYVVTTNSFVKINDELVMGRGAARQAVDNIPGIALECGKIIRERKGDDYSFLVIRPATHNEAGFGIFQVKRFWGEDAKLPLIKNSALKLWSWAMLNQDVNIRMNYPGIGNGKLSREDVEPLIKRLAEIVTICYK